jgi:energy-converting hydrogenase Eha subunit G
MGWLDAPSLSGWLKRMLVPVAAALGCVTYGTWHYGFAAGAVMFGSAIAGFAFYLLTPLALRPFMEEIDTPSDLTK